MATDWLLEMGNQIKTTTLRLWGHKTWTLKAAGELEYHNSVEPIQKNIGVLIILENN